LKLPDGVKFFEMKPGIHRIDILPFTAGKGNPYADEGELHFERTFWIHRGIGPDGNAFVCPRKTANEPCPICEARTKLSKDPDADEDLIKDIAPKERQLWAVFDQKNPDKGIQIIDMSFHLFGKQLDARVRNADDDDKYALFADPEEGFTLKLGVVEKHFGKQTYNEVETIDFKQREPLDEDLLKNVPCLDELLVVLPYEKLKSIFLQTSEAGKDDDDDEDEPKKGKKSSKDDDDEEDEPKKGKKSSKDDDGADCVACDGSGKSSKGLPCKPCGGTGRSKIDWRDEEDRKKPTKHSKSSPNDGSTKSKGKCPAGGQFGKDTDKLKGCDDCELWDACDEAKYSKKK
jgi:hypothetical protein